jgi:hypothetical protein
VALKVAGPLVFITSARESSRRITILRMNNGPALPYAFVGTLDFTFPANWEHTSYALAARPAPGGPANTYELYFNVGSTANFEQTTDPIGLSGLLQGTMQGASIYRVTVTDTGLGATVSNLTQIARGLRNAAGMDFHSATGDLYFEDNGIDGLQTRDVSLSADELNRVAAADLGRIVPNFGFPTDYIDAATGQRVGSGGVQPLVAFRPLPCDSCPDPVEQAESEGPSGIAFAPPGFPSYVNNGVFVGFHGKFNASPPGNEENPLVFWDLGTGQYFHFIEAFQLGHGDQLLSTEDSLFIADLSANGSMNTNGGAGVVYQIASRRQPETLRVFITQPDTDGTTVSGMVWFTIWLENAGAGPRDVTLSIDGVAVGTTSSTSNGPISMPWNSAGAAGGTHTATVTVRDGAGKTGSANRTVVIQSGSIRVFITDPATDGTVFGGTVWFTIWLENAAAGTRTLTLSIDGVPVGTTASTANGPISMPWDSAGAAGGTHTATVSVRDGVGNGGSASRTVVIPSISVFITAPESDGATLQGTTWFTIWVENAAAGSKVYTMNVDGTVVGTINTTSNGPVSMPWTTSGVANGSHSVTISVLDSAGHAGQAVRVGNVAN